MIPYIGMMLAALLIGIACVLVLDKDRSRLVASISSGIVAILAIIVFASAVAAGSIHFSENYTYYISQLNTEFGFTLTPISLTLLLMASIVAFVTVYAGNPEHEKERTASALILLFEFAAIGLFASGNLLLFFIFWDIGVVALFFMLYILGSANRRRAAIKFLIYELLASLLLLFAIMLIYFYTPVHSFNISYIMQNATSIATGTQDLIFAFFFIAFLINMPVFPLHLWLPDAHTEASTQGSMLLSGVLTKFGGYGMILAFTLIPASTSSSLFVAMLGGFSAFYTAFVLMTQHDIKRVIAYTTIVEMSIILVGIASLNQFGIVGATFMMLAHGFVISMLFLTAGSIGHIFADRDIRAVKGVVAASAATAYTLLIGVFATTGLPLTATFIGDILIFLGTIKTFSYIGALPLLALGIVGAYLYYVLNKSVFSTKEASKAIEYIGMSQKMGFAILMFFIFLFGLLPFLVLNFFNV